MVEIFLNSVKTQFTYYKSLGEKTFDQLEDQDLFWQYNTESNSIAILVNHLWGNMLSRWTDFLNSDGEKWNDGWDCLFKALDTINEENFYKKVYIRNEEHNIPDAVNRQLAHYASHIGQIVYIGRMIKGPEWKSLSIPKGQSKEFNAQKFEKGKIAVISVMI